MSDKQAGGGDNRDARSQPGPAGADGPKQQPNSFTGKGRDEDEASLDEGIDRLVDPSLGIERLSNNFDVLDLDREFIVESEEPDFTDDPGTNDLTEVVEEDGVYFPPTDPPVGLRRTGISVVDGFVDTSLEGADGTEDIDDHPLRVQGNDEELAEQVRTALAADSYTADLNLEVEVEYGVVYLHGKVNSLEDIDQAEQIAGSVPGVEDVEEDLEIV